jgi:hypothetical protein
MGVRQAYARRKKNNLKSLYFHLVVLADGGSIGWGRLTSIYLLLYYLEYVFTKDSGTMELNTKRGPERPRGQVFLFHPSTSPLLLLVS